MSAGVLAGCGGMFLPYGGGGFSPLSKGVPWVVQSALYGSAFYYYAGVSTGTGTGGVSHSTGHQIGNRKCWSRLDFLFENGYLLL